MSPDPMAPVKVGVIGIGNMGWHHARVLSLLRDADLVGVADPDADRGKLATEQFGCRCQMAIVHLQSHPAALACLQIGRDRWGR